MHKNMPKLNGKTLQNPKPSQNVFMATSVGNE